MKNTCAKTIKELHHFQRLQQALKKLRKERKEMMEQLVSLERRKAKIDNQVTEGQKKLTKLKDKETRAEGCLKFLKELELLRN
jgi:predicted  nucleic acid-binding Zn-ribbon protein